MRLLFAAIIVLFSSAQLKAQLFSNAVPFVLENESIKSFSLGNSTVSLQGYPGATHTNPAAFGSEGVLEGSFFANYNEILVTSLDNRITSFYTSYVPGKFGIASSFKKIKFLDRRDHQDERIPNYEYIFNISSKYNFENGLKLGAGINYIYSDIGERGISGPGIGGQELSPGSSFSFDIGLQYEQAAYVNDHLVFIPSGGFSLTDFGSAISYMDNSEGDPLPMMMRGGIGLKLQSRQMIANLPLFEMTYSGGLSKLMGRKEMAVKNGIDTTYVPMNPFKALFKSWKSYEYFNGVETQEVGLGDQIWIQNGLEVSLLNTLFLRIGKQKVKKPDSYESFTAYGFGIDLFYLTFDYAHADSDSYLKDGSHWQLTGRIPLDGKRPDSILNTIF